MRKPALASLDACEEQYRAAVTGMGSEARVGAFKSQPFHLLLVEFYEMSFGAGCSNFSICECGGTDREPRYHPQDCREESGSITYM